MTTPTHDVCAIGNAIVDIISTCDDLFLDREDIRKASMTLIERDRARHLTALADQPDMVSGGSAANTISGLVACGGRGAFIGKVGQDPLGKIFHKDMVSMGVAYRTPFYVGNDLETARCHIFVTPDGERSMNTYLGVSVEFGVGDLDEELIKAAQITYLEGYLYDKESARLGFERAAEIAKAAGRKTAITLSDSWCVDRHRAEFQNLVRHSMDIVFANENEMLALAETENLEAAIETFRGTVPLMAITRSEKGALVVTADEIIEVPTTPVAKLTDATGAGDQFAAGFLYGQTHGMGLKESAALGCKLASHVIQVIGPRLTVDPRAWVKSAA